MPLETFAARLIAETLGSGSLNEYPEAPRHDQLLRRALRRRRVTLRPVGESSQVFVFGGVVVGGMDSVVTTLVSAHARRITADAQLLRRHLEIQELPLPAEDAAAARRAPGEASGPSRVRAFVVGDRVCCSLLRVPATVLGDGRSTLAQLILHDAGVRSRHALLADSAVPGPVHAPTGTDVPAGTDVSTSRGVSTSTGASTSTDVATSTVQSRLRDRGFDPEQVPAEGSLMQLQDSAELASGGLTIDVTGMLPDALHELAAEAVMAVPGLYAAAVDLLVPDLESAEDALVLTVLPDADIRPAHMPAYGESRDVAGAIADEILLRASR
ncbi:hypothetical protein [Nesterenkonia jeotgali]|uniref:Uncharacterized protein n=1 Tax=Nesterenkonia jeotgali TaxID=317018 RepID=A0A839FU36_9MICC|nr:hypothetical protein [Nesterenkonia jeotgali]MBA8921782.1 hypothetical protein [Nesterenkonia jeotgali]